MFRDKNVIMSNELDNWKEKHPDTKKFKGEYARTKFTMMVNEMPTPKLNYDSKLNRIKLGYPKK